MISIGRLSAELVERLRANVANENESAGDADGDPSPGKGSARGANPVAIGKRNPSRPREEATAGDTTARGVGGTRAGCENE